MTELERLTAWPTTAEDMTADLLIRIVGADTQRLWLEKWREIDAHGVQSTPLYHARTQAIIGGVGLMACVRSLQERDADAANEFARDYWSMCDAGDSFGEYLWELTRQAGLNPELIELPPAVPCGRIRR